MDEELMNKFSEILKEKNIDLNSVLENFNSNSKNSSNTENKSESTNNDFDINTIMKIKKILDNSNSNNNDSNLLLALKPYLRSSRQKKIEQYSKMLKIAKAFQTFQNMGGDN